MPDCGGLDSIHQITWTVWKNKLNYRNDTLNDSKSGRFCSYYFLLLFTVWIGHALSSPTGISTSSAQGGVGGRRPSREPVNNNDLNWHTLLMKGRETMRLILFFVLKCTWKRMWAFLLVFFLAGLLWFPFRLSVPETRLCEQWSGEAWTQPPMAISVERRQPNKQRKAWCAQVTAQPVVKKHLCPGDF